MHDLDDLLSTLAVMATMPPKLVSGMANDAKVMAKHAHTLRTAPFYDLDNLLDVADPAVIAEIEARGSIQLLTKDRVTAIRIVWRNEPAIAVITAPHHVHFYVRRNSGWTIVEPNDESHRLAILAYMVTVDAELNHEENVEFIDRPSPLLVLAKPDTGRRLHKGKAVRIISLTRTRKEYVGRVAKPHQGGTHARPVEHVRVLTRRLIEPKNRKPYWREAQVIIVNRGIRRVTKVVL